MNVRELTREQLTELKQRYYTEQADERGEDVSMDVYIYIDDYITDNEIMEAYDSYTFTSDDFFCTCNE